MKQREIYARLSKGGRILCGSRDADGHCCCDGLVATTITVPGPLGGTRQRLAPPEGWRLDQRKGIWHLTTQLADRRAHGRPARPLRPESRGYPFLPALVRCPKCGSVQWLDPAHLQPGDDLPRL